MRKQFEEYLFDEMAKNPDMFLVTGDLGYGLWDRIRNTYPDRFINAGASEQAGTGLCVGLAYAGKIPLFYSIATFALYRPFETIKIYLHHERIPVKIIAGGRDRDYHIDGYSHDATENPKFIEMLNLKSYFPKNLTPKIFKEMIYNGLPCYVSLKK